MTRYLRQVGLPEFGAAAQATLAQSRVLIVGCGGLGAVTGQYLAAAGVGRLTLVDGDEVELSNLPRQLWFNDESVGRAKAECAAARLRELAPAARIEARALRLEAANAIGLAGGHDLILDCVDDFRTKQLLNEVAYRLDLPLVFASVVGFDGMVGSFHPGRSSCLRCLFPFSSLSSPTSCALNGVLGPAVGVVGSYQALEAIRILARGEIDAAIAPRFGTVWNIDLRTGATQSLLLPRRPDCICNGGALRLLGSESPRELGWEELEESYALLDVREADELSRGAILTARHWPLSRLESGQIPDFLEANRPWALFCAKGKRSERAVELLSEALPGGIFVSVRGGLAARWV